MCIRDSVIIMQNDVAVPNTAATVSFDGKDKIGGTNAIAVSRMIFASGTLSVLAPSLIHISEPTRPY